MADVIYGLHITYNDPLGRRLVADYYGESEAQVIDRFWQGRSKNRFSILKVESLGAYRKSDEEGLPSREGTPRRALALAYLKNVPHLRDR